MADYTAPTAPNRSRYADPTIMGDNRYTATAAERRGAVDPHGSAFSRATSRMSDAARKLHDDGTAHSKYTGKSSLARVVGGLTYDGHNIANNLTTATGKPVNTRKAFLQVLESWEAALPLQSLWMVFFKVPDIVRDEVMSAWGEHIIRIPSRRGLDKHINIGHTKVTEELEGGVNTARRRLLKPKFQTTVGCAFAQTVQMPPEQIATDYVGIPNSRGFLQGPVITTRQRFASVNIEFLETNLSFIDMLLRPWAILGSHFGSIARRDTPITTDIMVINFSKAGFEPEFQTHTYSNDSNEHGPGTTYTDDVPINKSGFVPRKIWLFHGAQPINIGQERVSYTEEGSVDRRNVEWIFKRYQIMVPTSFESWMDFVDANEEPMLSDVPYSQGINAGARAAQLHYNSPGLSIWRNSVYSGGGIQNSLLKTLMGVAKNDSSDWWTGKSPDGSTRNLGMIGTTQEGGKNKIVPLIGNDPRTKRAKRNADKLADPVKYWAGEDLVRGSGSHGQWEAPIRSDAHDSTPPSPSYDRWQPKQLAESQPGVASGYRNEAQGFGDGKRKFSQRADHLPAQSLLPPYSVYPSASQKKIFGHTGSMPLKPGMRKLVQMAEEQEPARLAAELKEWTANESMTQTLHQQLDAPYGIIGAKPGQGLQAWKNIALTYGAGTDYPNIPGSNTSRYQMETGTGYQEKILVQGKGAMENKGKPRKYYKSRTDILSILFGL